MMMRIRIPVALAVLTLALTPLHAQDVMEISFRDAATPATTLRLADIGKVWFADDMLQASSLSTPAQISQFALSGISSIKFKNSQTAVRALSAPADDGYTVYDLQGRQMLATRSLSALKTLPRGVYIVRSNNKTVKISI